VAEIEHKNGRKEKIRPTALLHIPLSGRDPLCNEPRDRVASCHFKRSKIRKHWGWEVKGTPDATARG